MERELFVSVIKLQDNHRCQLLSFQNESKMDIPGGPVAKMPYSTGGLASVPGAGTRSYMPQLRPDTDK